MSKTNIEICYRLHLDGAVHIGTGTGNSGFLDKYYYRDQCKAGGREPVIPGSTIKGRIRNAIQSLVGGECISGGSCRGDANCDCLICLMFGQGGIAHHTGRRGALAFDDARPVVAGTDALATIRHGVAIDRYRQVALDQHLFTYEVAGGQGIVFEGRITGVVPADRADEVQLALKAAFRLEYGMGYGKSRGLGWVQVDEIPIGGDGV